MSEDKKPEVRIMGIIGMKIPREVSIDRLMNAIEKGEIELIRLLEKSHRVVVKEKNGHKYLATQSEKLMSAVS